MLTDLKFYKKRVNIIKTPFKTLNNIKTPLKHSKNI